MAHQGGLEPPDYSMLKVRQKVLAIVQLALPSWIRTPTFTKHLAKLCDYRIGLKG